MSSMRQSKLRGSMGGNNFSSSVISRESIVLMKKKEHIHDKAVFDNVNGGSFLEQDDFGVMSSQFGDSVIHHLADQRFFNNQFEVNLISSL